MSSVYLDSTVPSYLCDDRDSTRTYIEVTRKWWSSERGKFDIWISEETINELHAGDYPRKEEVLKSISGIQVLPPNEEIIEVAKVYIENRLMARRLGGDALHLAYASLYKIDFLLTWNCNHLANANKRRHIRIINTRLNLATPEIITPLELFTEKDDDDY